MCYMLNDEQKMSYPEMNRMGEVMQSGADQVARSGR